MDAAKIATLMALIPERTCRAQMGSAFRLHESHGERIALVSRYLSWMTPLAALTKDEQRALGLLATHPRSAEVEPEEADVELEPETPEAELREADADPDPDEPPFDPDATLPGTFEEEADEEAEEIHAAANLDP